MTDIRASDPGVTLSNRFRPTISARIWLWHLRTAQILLECYQAFWVEDACRLGVFGMLRVSSRKTNRATEGCPPSPILNRVMELNHVGGTSSRPHVGKCEWWGRLPETPEYHSISCITKRICKGGGRNPCFQIIMRKDYWTTTPEQLSVTVQYNTTTALTTQGRGLSQ
jgi:hypothetical protein